MKRDDHAVIFPKRLLNVVERVMTLQRIGFGRHLGMSACELPARAVVMDH